MRRFTFRRSGLVVLAGVVLAASAGATATMTAASAAPRPATATNAPCKTATYAISLASPTQSGFSLSISGQVDFSADAATANVTLPSNFPVSFLAGSTLQVVLVGGTAYVSVPAALSGFAGGASWISLALPANLNGALDGVLTHLASFCANPQSTLGTMGSRRHGATSLGTSSIEGVAVRGSHLNAPARRFKKTFGVTKAVSTGNWSVGSLPVPITVWVNPQGQLSQVSITLPDITITITVTNIDQAVTIAAPSGAVPLSPSVLGMLGGFFGQMAPRAAHDAHRV
jgi:hypothetical protein